MLVDEIGEEHVSFIKVVEMDSLATDKLVLASSSYETIGFHDHFHAYEVAPPVPATS